MAKYTLGIDFGTLSARAILVETGTGKELSQATMDYPHGVMDERLPTGEKLPAGWALQHPGDYLECLRKIVPEAVLKSGVEKRDIVGVGIDFTSSTVLPIDRDGTPLCFSEEFARNPHTWVKLWKHHGAQAEAREMTALVRARGDAFLDRYGGIVSSEWTFPKLLETLRQAPEVYARADQFIEAGDWLVLLLTGNEARSASMAGYKAFWSAADGYPSGDFFRALDPRMERVVDEKLAREVLFPGARAGGLTRAGAELLGLLPGTAVAAASIDAHVSLPAAGSVEPGRMLMIMGTSTCFVMVSGEERAVPGTCGVVLGGVVPGLYGYEAGQSCVGDGFNWFVENCVPEGCAQAAREAGVSVHGLLAERAERLKPGESGLVALDWWNGNRSVLVDAELSGLILGMTLQTKPEELYRALIEATAFGARAIVEAFEGGGVAIKELVACGGISKKNPFLMQIYADVLNREIKVVTSHQAPALGAAMFGAVAAGREVGGYGDIAEAARAMGGVDGVSYRPNPESVRVYERLFREYQSLHDYFGRGGSDAMKRLRAIREEQRG